MLAIVVGVGLVLYQMTALVLAAPAVNRQIAIGLVLPAIASDDVGVPLGYGSQVFLGTLAPETEPPAQPDAATYRRTSPVKGDAAGPIIHPAPAVVASNDATPTDHDGVTAPVPVSVAQQVVPMAIGSGDGDRTSASQTIVIPTAPAFGTTQHLDD